MSNYGPSQFEKGSLRDQLKEGTRQVHGVADKLIADALLGDKTTGCRPINRATYRIFLSQLYYVYTSMEKALQDNITQKCIGPTHFPQELDRQDQLEKDLMFYYGDNWSNEISQLPSTTKYVNHINNLSRDNPMLLLSHSYVRYQGDLSGGQQIMKILQRLFQLQKEDFEGVSFFDFPNISSVKKFKDFYSARMNSLELSELEVNQLVQEAQTAFQMTIDVFAASLEQGKSLGVQDHGVANSEQIDREVKKLYGKGCPLMQHSTERKDTTSCPITAIYTSNKFTYGVLAVLIGITTIFVGPWINSKTFL